MAQSVADLITKAVQKCADETGAREFIATLGDCEWATLMTQQPQLRAPVDHVDVYDVILVVPAGRVECRLVRTCEGVHVASVDQLLVECARLGGCVDGEHTQARVIGLRGGKTADMTNEMLTRLTDEQVQAECKRRFGGETYRQSLEILGCKIASVERERAEARNQRNEAQVAAEAFAREATEARRDANAKGDFLDNYEEMATRFGKSDRQSTYDFFAQTLKRMDELKTGASIVIDSSKMKLDRAEVAGVVFRARDVAAIDTPSKLERTLATGRVEEMGDGLAARDMRPDNSIPFLDEELLCDDE